MKKINIGIIGAGGRGSGFLKRLVSVYSDQANVIGVADPNPVRAKAMMKNAEADCELYADAQDLLKLKQLDAVYITTPDYPTFRDPTSRNGPRSMVDAIGQQPFGETNKEGSPC